ncbi:HTH domain-containing protein [Streptomyces sp. ST1015]
MVAGGEGAASEGAGGGVELAEHLEVSVRTVYRDVEALS